ncbi:MAG TPA: GlsB/YeaQ/YmgE family stress response membrane protein [Candidatus Eisenbacteria bacterium]|nr:GlsB/YeaQ/YmgE family stress response membrane protein [Candidatus Eisenbacteria bacterium]
MHILWAIIIGLVVGILAKMIMPGRDPGGMLITMLLGIAGALVATFIGRSLGWYAVDQSAGFIASILGAIVLLALYRMIKRPRPVM